MSQDRDPYRILVVLAIALCAAVLVRTAWLCDDAYITFRTVDNFVDGHGLRYNLAERVQSYTHPLWMFLLAGLHTVTGEFYFSTLALSLVASLAAVWILAFRIAPNSCTAAFAVCVLVSSKAWIDFGTSGLENPLTYFLLALFFWLFLERESTPRTVFSLSLITALGVVNRMDTLLLFAPALALAFWEVRGWRALRAGLLGGLPLLLWEIFSLVYYGALTPNTAAAKLNTGIPAAEKWTKGAKYLANSVTHDPLTLIAIASAVAAVVFYGHTRRRAAIAAGAVAYVAYSVWIGGDFMSGRFLAAPLLCAAVLLTRALSSASRGTWLVASVAALGTGLLAPYPNLTSTALYDFHPPNDRNKILDERSMNYAFSGLLNVAWSGTTVDHPWAVAGRRAAASGEKVVTRMALGYFGLAAGPDLHVVDPLALSDPLLARIPAAREVMWKPGHFERHVPEGYLEVLRGEAENLADPQLDELYRHLRLITRGPIFDADRWAAIWKLHTGALDHLVDFERYRLATMIRTTLTELGHGLPARDEDGAIRMTHCGIEIDLEGTRTARALEIEVDHDDDYELTFYRGDEQVGARHIPQMPLPQRGMNLHRLDVPHTASSDGYDRLRVMPLGGVDLFRMGALRLD